MDIHGQNLQDINIFIRVTFAGRALPLSYHTLETVKIFS